MVKRLRRKFVVVTTIFMITIFGGFLIIQTIYNNYWNDMEISGMLNWIAHSGAFTSQNKMNEQDEILNILDDERPIIGYMLDNENNILSSRVLGSTNSNDSILSIDKEIISKMIQNNGRDIKIGHYYYSYNRIDDQKSLLVVMDDRFQKESVWWLVGTIILICLGVLLLIGVTFLLSGFVTKPAEQSLLREKRFISDASHELKTPLGAISINAQALQMDCMDNIYIKNIISESQRMGRLIEKLLILSKLDEVTDVFENVNISEICEEMVLTYDSMAFENGVKIEYESDPDIIIQGNADELRQLMVILIDNALKNTNEKGHIFISCKHKKKKVEILVSNTGAGIREEDLPHVFERFYTSDLSRNSGSFGLGLAIAKSIVSLHKGVINVTSTPDELTTFEIIL